MQFAPRQSHNRQRARLPPRSLLSLLLVTTVTSLAAYEAPARAELPTSAVDTTGLAVTDSDVTVGQLHSATGTMAISETGSIQAERLAIEQINASGGVLGRQIKIIQEDGASDWPTFAEKAKKLLVSDKVCRRLRLLDFGIAQGGIARFRKGKRVALLSDLLRGSRTIEERLLHGPRGDPADFGGLDWLYKEKKAKTYFLIGSDYIWPRTSNKIARKHIENVLHGHRRRRRVLSPRHDSVRVAHQQNQAQKA